LLDVALNIRDKGLTPTIPIGFPPQLREMLASMWEYRQEERLTIEQVVAALQAQTPE